MLCMGLSLFQLLGQSLISVRSNKIVIGRYLGSWRDDPTAISSLDAHSPLMRRSSPLTTIAILRICIIYVPCAGKIAPVSAPKAESERGISPQPPTQPDYTNSINKRRSFSRYIIWPLSLPSSFSIPQLKRDDIGPSTAATYSKRTIARTAILCARPELTRC